MAAKMKLRIKSSALDSHVEPYVLPDTPDVLSVGKRCVEKGWYFWWPPWSKRPVLSPPKGKGKPIHLSVSGNIPYVRERPDFSVEAAPAPITNFALRSSPTGSGFPDRDRCEVAQEVGVTGASSAVSSELSCSPIAVEAALVCEPCAPSVSDPSADGGEAQGDQAEVPEPSSELSLIHI